MCGNIHNSTVEQSVCFCILHDGLQTSISFHPLTLANSADPDEMHCPSDLKRAKDHFLRYNSTSHAKTIGPLIQTQDTDTWSEFKLEA